MYRQYKEGMYQSTIQCPNCKKHCVDSCIPYSNNPWLIWYDCGECGYEWDGEKPHDSESYWVDIRGNND